MKQEKIKVLYGPVATDYKHFKIYRTNTPLINSNHCKLCKQCVDYCPCGVIAFNEDEKKIDINLDYCKGCGICATVCKFNAIKIVEENCNGEY